MGSGRRRVGRCRSVRQQKLLEDDRTEPVTPPDGLYVKPIETSGELGAFHRAVEAVFNLEDSVEVYRILQQAPSYIPELDLVLLSAGGEVAAFCIVWLDRESGLAEFEPVGTVPQYRRRGLGAALLADASNRLHSAGCGKATAFSWSASVGANRLYAGTGLGEKDKLYNWQWRGA